MTDKTSAQPDFSGTRSGSSSTAPSSSPSSRTEGTTPQTGTRTYVVVKGDSLSKIAQREYGDAQQWRRIFEANRDMIQDPDLIHPGQTLRLP
jgi:nucleoid-associated protein YgaU